MKFPASQRFFGAAAMLLLCAWLTVGSRSVSADNLPALTGRVVDNAALLSSGQRTELTGMLADFEQRTNGTQIVVAIIPSLGGENQFDYSLRLFKAWKPGQAGKNNGVLLLIARDDRKISIRTGYGVETTLTNAKADTIIRTTMAPAFKQANYYQGIRQGLVEMMQAVDANAAPSTGQVTTGASPSVASNPVPTTPEPQPAPQDNKFVIIGLMFFGLIAGGVIGVIALAVGGIRWLVGLGKRCPQCSQSTFTTVSDVVLAESTYTSSGYGVRTKQCSSCAYQDIQNYSLAMLTYAATDPNSYNNTNYGSNAGSSTDYGSSSYSSSGSDSGFSGGGGDSGGSGADGGW